MHPILGSPARLGIYTLAWLPIAAILALVLSSRGGILPSEAASLAVLLTFVHATLGLAVWYVCRANPLAGTAVARAVVAHGVAGLLFGSLWQQIGRVTAWVGARIVPAWDGLDARLRPELTVLFALGILLYLLHAAFYYLLAAFETSREAERRQAELRIQAADAELRSLRAQLNPHFLFNSLHSISSLTTREPAAAREMCVRLADFLRKGLGLGDRDRVTLAEELALVEDYLAVESVRLGSRLRIERRVEPGLSDVPVPPLVLQPLVENAILHGVATLTEGGVLSLSAGRRGVRLVLTVENPFDPASPRRGGAGRGIDNVRRRVSTHYDGDAALSAAATGDRYRASLILPLAHPGRRS